MKAGVLPMISDKLNINRIEIGDIHKIAIKGYLDAQTAPTLEDELHSIVHQGKTKILVNFKDLIYISSAGLGVFMSYIEQIRKAGGDIKLAEMPENVFSVFDLLGFPLLFDISRDENILIEKFKRNEVPLNDF